MDALRPLILASGLLAAAAAGAQDAQDLAKQVSNPISSLISVPFQYNYNDGYGPQDGHQNYVNIQPVIPFTLTPKWNMIVRTIVPVIDQSDVVPGTGSQFGLGDTTQSLFLSPKSPGPGGLIWGVGPAFLWPTATEDELGSGKWGVGPTGVALVQKGHWTYGLLANHIWSVADAGGEDRPDVSSTFLQPFVAYNTKTAVTFTLNSESTYDWKDSEWSVPINAMVSKTTHIGKQPVQFGVGARYWVETPESGPDGWGARAIVTFLFPKGKS
ncbi:transporter [Amaricoccus sp.]|uniref:transporter n=1 Tax=Amaricoccus sp. TaxID=1872485 RepID=UPI001B3F324B|nr:transporter [Amaricoccus sp.]MBP7243272.1 transporter [Amaricoccus sp.]